jgi:DNA-binding NarL/FixJ family response regulator
MTGGAAPIFKVEVESQARTTAETLNTAEIKNGPEKKGPLAIGLIDCFHFTRECVVKALETIRPSVTVVAFPSVQACIAAQRTDLDVILDASHASAVSEARTVQRVVALRRAFPEVRLIVLSDVAEAQQPKLIRSALKNGANGFIPIRTTKMPMAVAAIRFVLAGGVFAPLDSLLSNPPDGPTASPPPPWQRELTSRQMAVLSHLQQGKANKLIAHELSVSESAVKVHVRNIMRKMGAANRTQAAYKAQNLWNSTEFAKSSDL